MPSRARWLRIRWTQARSSSALRALASDSIGSGWRTFVSAPTGSSPMRCVGESGRDELGVLGLERAQLVEQRVVLVVADLRVVERVVAVAVVGQLAAQWPPRAWPPWPERSPQLARGRREQPREVVRGERVDALDVGQVEVDRRDRDAPLGDGREVGARLVVVAGIGAVDPVAAARRRRRPCRAAARRDRCACRGA